MIDPTAVSTIRVGELSPEPFSLTDNVPHEVGTELKRGTIEDLATFISAFIGSTDGVGFRAISVTDGQTLPTTTQQEFILVGKGTYYNVVGGSTIICTEELNAIVSNGSYWFIGVEIPVNVELAGITQFVRDGFINTTPSEDAVYEALALKANVADSENIANKQNDLTPDGTGTKYPTVDAVNTIDLQKVIDVNGYAEKGNNYIDILGEKSGNHSVEVYVEDFNNTYLNSSLRVSTEGFSASSIGINKSADFVLNNGFFITEIENLTSKSTTLKIETPIESTTLNFPAKTIAGTYTLATTDETVNLTGDQTIEGNKQFTDNLSVDSNILLLNTDADGYGEIRNDLNRFTFINQFGNIQFLMQNSGFATYKSPTISGTFSNANLTASRTFTLPDATGTIPIVTQTITNGVTDKSPSEDAIFDALDLKVSGSGTTNYLPKFTASGTVGNSQIFDNGTNVGINTGAPLSALQVNTSGQGFIRIGGSDGRTIESFTNAGVSSNTTVANLSTTNIYSTNIIDKTSNQLAVNFGANFIAFKTTNTEKVRLVVSGALLLNKTTDDGIATNKLQVNGNITASAATLSNQVVVKSQLDAIRPYKVYTALLTQVGTDAPTAIVLENTIGAIVWSRSVIGGYFATLSGAFTTDKTSVLITNGSANSTYIHGAQVSTSNVNVITLADGQIDKATIEIRVYN